ncbi:Lactonase, 7-bladed beta-propeller-domain-containing protein [Diaporthe sp. PMI_573]|nr:Lactonase, 7-bladed beta-propeller-domain-containing protein [Diaporthaceae sp. PMI_573]
MSPPEYWASGCRATTRGPKNRLKRSLQNILVAHYSGTISTLTLAQNSRGTYDLYLNSSLTIGGQPSWLTFDDAARTLYSSDETSYGSASVTAVLAAKNGGLTLAGKTTAATGGAVANTLYGNGFVAVAHYQGSMISTYKLPLSPSGTVLQKFSLTQSQPGTNPWRQEAAHPHQVIVDPTGRFLLAPDLGSDEIRIYAMSANSGILTACPSYIEVGGTGPRHGTFAPNGLFYVANELANTVHAFDVSYSSNCISLSQRQIITTMAGNKTAPSGTKLGEIHVKGNNLYVSNRRDLTFNPNDSLTSFNMASNGFLTFQNITSSGGTYPRTFHINKSGDLVVIGDQTTANVVVVERDVTNGLLGAQIASLRVGSVGTPENDNGLSSVLWDD